MLILRVSRLSAFCLLLASSFAAQAQELLIQRTGVSFPEELHSFVRQGEIDFEATVPRGGTGVRFELDGKYKATVIAYKLDVSPFPQSITDPPAAVERSHVVQTIVALAKGPNPNGPTSNSRRSLYGMYKIKAHPEVPVTLDSFILYPNGMASNTFLFMWIAKAHIWRLRIDRMPGPPGETPLRFAEGVVEATLGN